MDNTSLPRWWADRVWNLNEAATIIATPYDTVYRWCSLIRATGLFFGEKRGREWLFDAHEIYTLRLLGAFMRAGIPVGPTHIRATVFFAFSSDGAPARPDDVLTIEGPASRFEVDAPAIFASVMSAIDPAHEDMNAKYH